MQLLRFRMKSFGNKLKNVLRVQSFTKSFRSNRGEKLGENCSEPFQDEILETENVQLPTYLDLSEDGLEMEWGRTLPSTWS